MKHIKHINEFFETETYADEQINNDGFLVEYNGWKIKWNHRRDHDMEDRIEDRTDYDLSYVNGIISIMVDYIEEGRDNYESGTYNVEFKKSKFKAIITIIMDINELFIGTILSEWQPVKRKVPRIVLFESLKDDYISSFEKIN